VGLLLDLRRSSCILACNIIPYYSIILSNSCILEVTLVLYLLWLSYTQSRPLRNSGRLELSFLSEEHYSALVKHALHDVSDYLRTLTTYKATPRWLPPFNDDDFTVVFQFPHFKFHVNNKLVRQPLFHPIGRDAKGDSIPMTWDDITPGCIVRVAVTNLFIQSLTVV
jgi:hypothetical protein